MSSSIIVSASSSAAGGVELQAAVGLGVGGIFVAVSLVYLFGYLDLLSAVEMEESRARGLRSMLIAVIVPLSITFGSILLIQAGRVVGYL